MQEILPGVLHWTAYRDTIEAHVSSYFVEPAGIVVDPMVPEEGLDALAGRARPQQVVLTSGLHARDAARFAEAFGCPVLVSREGAERIGDALQVESYTGDADIAPGVRALHVGVLAPDEYVLHIEAGGGALLFADALVRYGDSLAFVPDELMGADPAGVKEGLRNRFRALLERDFDHLLFAHGTPLVRGGKAALRDFATSPVGHEDFGRIR